MNMSNIAHTINGDDVTLGWDTDDLTWYVNINIFNPSKEVRVYLWKTKISDKTFSYKKQRDGEQNLWFINNCWELKYKINE
jgi:hypothetical protein